MNDHLRQLATRWAFVNGVGCWVDEGQIHLCLRVGAEVYAAAVPSSPEDNFRPWDYLQMRLEAALADLLGHALKRVTDAARIGEARVTVDYWKSRPYPTTTEPERLAGELLAALEKVVGVHAHRRLSRISG